ncbi:MAG: VanZ family protein [Gammaproteobacteria bacterium]|nr:VanZ family protein [Gammaproteobacteria bacterium]
MISRCNREGFRLLLGLALVVATWLALTPQPVPLPDAPLSDKWAHLLAYLVLAFLADASWPDRRFTAPKWSGLLLYGIAIELLQTQIPNRVFSIGDIVANGAGIALYAFGGIYLLQRLGWR